MPSEGVAASMRVRLGDLDMVDASVAAGVLDWFCVVAWEGSDIARIARYGCRLGLRRRGYVSCMR